ncbi:MAG: hypothetical protein M0P71_01310 [Melioribacteraceae bacterium]|nr:hypothetical protein [Melioribacteraceae bacterium]
MDFIFFPVLIANSIGFEATFLLTEMINSNINMLEIRGSKWTKAQLSSLNNSKIGFLSDEQIKVGLDNLYKKGFVIRLLRSGKKTSIYSVNILNLMLFEILHEKYFDIITPVTGKTYEANLVDVDLFESIVKTSDIKELKASTIGDIPLYSMNKIQSKKFIKEIIYSIYKIDVNNLNKYVIESNGEFIIDFSKSKLLEDKTPKYISSLILPCDITALIDNLKIIQFSHLYNGIYEINNLGKIKISSKLIPYGKQQDIIEEEVEEVEEVETVTELKEESLKEMARTNYESFCKYMKISTSMKKPIREWTSRDFVSYFYCGMAKLTMLKNKEENIIEDIKFPNFIKDCSIMKKNIERYGNKKLSEMIKTLILDYENIKYKYKIKDLNIHIGIFGIEWIVSRIESYMKYKHELELSQDIDFRIREMQKETKEEVGELEKEKKDAILATLRNNINNGD